MHKPSCFNMPKFDTSITTCQLFKSLAGHTGIVRATLLHQDNKMLSCGDDHNIFMWDLITGEKLLVFDTNVVTNATYLAFIYTMIKLPGIANDKLIATAGGENRLSLKNKEVADWCWWEVKMETCILWMLKRWKLLNNT